MSVQKVALITASSAGLGAQVARVLAPDFRVVSIHLGPQFEKHNFLNLYGLSCPSTIADVDR